MCTLFPFLAAMQVPKIKRNSDFKDKAKVADLKSRMTETQHFWWFMLTANIICRQHSFWLNTSMLVGVPTFASENKLKLQVFRDFSGPQNLEYPTTDCKHFDLCQ